MIAKEKELLFTEESVDKTSHPLAKIIRKFFAKKQMTVDNFIARYVDSLSRKYPSDSLGSLKDKARADQIVISDSRNINFNMFSDVMKIMGYQIKSISMEIYDPSLDETQTIATEMFSSKD